MNTTLTRTRPVAAEKTVPAAKPKKSRPAKKPVPASLKHWAYAGVVLTLALSAWLNGLAFSKHAEVSWHGWVLGLLIPVLILVFSRVGGILWACGNRARAYVAGGACGSMLVLSVQHCAVSIAALTGEPVLLAALMALAIDAGLVICELSTVEEKQ